MREIFVFRVPEFPKMFQRFPNVAEDIRRFLKMIWRFPNVNEEFVSSSTMRLDMVWRIQTQHIALFTGLCFLALVRVYFLKIIAQNFQPGMRNWSVSVSWREVEVFNQQAWNSRLRHESWQVYQTAEQEVTGSNPGWITNQGLKITTLVRSCWLCSTPCLSPDRWLRHLAVGQSPSSYMSIQRGCKRTHDTVRKE